MGGPPFGDALAPTNPPFAQSHFTGALEEGTEMACGLLGLRFRPHNTLKAMTKFLLPLCATALLLALGACSHKKPKSSAHIYGGDSPTIKYSEKQETAGGYIRTY
jgi:hypothetical protein